MGGRRLVCPLTGARWNFYIFMVVGKRLNITGPAMAFVTTTVKDWQPVFSDLRIANLTLKQLDETLNHYHVSLVAYVLMPSHIHLLLGFREIKKLSEVIQSFKGLSAKKLRGLLLQESFATFYDGQRFNFWKPRFDDFIVSSEEKFKIKIEYIHNNPVKAGLVSQPTGYTLSSANDWLKRETGILPVDKNWTWNEE